jgi:hypothetical protein
MEQANKRLLTEGSAPILPLVVLVLQHRGEELEQ